MWSFDVARRVLPTALAAGLFSVACQPSARPGTPPRPNATSAAAEPSGSGGMWLPEQLPALGDRLRQLGLRIDVSQLSSPMQFPLSAVVSLGGCSASFVSPQGLIVTNHHCVIGALQYNATPEQNLVERGYLAKTQADEKSIGPTGRVFVTQAFTDVTEEVRRGIEGIAAERERYFAVEKRTKDIVRRCEAAQPNRRCDVASFFGGAQFLLVERLEIEDVRLVYAPAAGVGNFGGEIDNWRWPRHTGDFAFFRAYVGPDGKPRPHAPDNVPYRPPAFLKPAKRALRPGDLVMVAGYPGRTARLHTSFELAEEVEFAQPYRIAMCEQYLPLIEKLGKSAPELEIKAAPLERGLANALTYTRGALEGLQKGRAVEQKRELEARLTKFIAADPARQQRWGNTLPELSQIFARGRALALYDAVLGELVRMSSLLSAAVHIVRMADERAKPDAERDPQYQERNWDDLEQASRALERRYDRRLDRALLTLALQRASRIPPGDDRRALLRPFTTKTAPSDAELAQAVDGLYATTTLERAETRIALLTKASKSDLEKTTDPMLRAALGIVPLLLDQRARDHAESGALLLSRARYVAALREMTPAPLAPDANGTLRVTFGTVRGFAPKPGVPAYFPFTTASQVLSKHTGTAPFDAPAALLDAVRARRFGGYADEQLGDVPLDFLADCDITGGNSGSATLDADGNLTGLAFDGNYEAMASDWLFMPSITRSIHVDLRYMAWIMDAVDSADHLLVEMGIEPSIP